MLERWTHHYNWHRPHQGINGLAPMSRLARSRNNLLTLHSYSNRFTTALEGVDIDNPGAALDRSGHPNPVPPIVGPIRRKHPV
jgi:hypothetical protein